MGAFLFIAAYANQQPPARSARTAGGKQNVMMIAFLLRGAHAHIHARTLSVCLVKIARFGRQLVTLLQ